MSLKVLMSAYACEPGKGSEPGVGWNVAREMARRHDVWVLTRANNRPAIEAELARNPVPGLRFIWHDLPRWARWWKRGGRGVQFYYYLWQLSAIRAVRRAHAEVGFDIAHHVTFVKYWVPTCLAFLPVPFVWGPVGGGESAPFAFWPGFGRRGIMYEFTRTFVRTMAEFDPFVRMSVRRAAIALATTEQTADRLRKLKAKAVHLCSEAGLSPAEIDLFGSFEKREHRQTIRFLSVGRLIHWKGFHLGIEAFARAGLSDAEYCLIGDGSERARLESQCRRLGVEKRVHFLGAIPRKDVLEKLVEADAFVHPSLHDSGGWACLEAMTAGKPVICLGLGGPGYQVTPECGVVVSATNVAMTIRQLADAMRQIAQNRDVATAMGQAGQRRISEFFTWSRKVVMLSCHYEDVVSMK